MKKQSRTKKILITSFGLLLLGGALSGCTQSFCGNEDLAHLMFALDAGITQYVDTSDSQAVKDCSYNYITEYQANPSSFELVFPGVNDHLYKRIIINNTSSYVYTINSTAKSSDIKIPSNEYFYKMDQKLFDTYWDTYEKEYNRFLKEDNPKTQGLTEVSKANATIINVKDFLYGGYNDSNWEVTCPGYGFLKFYNNDFSDKNTTLWTNYDSWVEQVKTEIGAEKCASVDYLNLYKNALLNNVKNTRTCISTRTSGTYQGYFFGQEGSKVYYKSINWGDAWKKGLLEGLIVFPVAWAVESMSFNFGLGGWGQVGAILLITLIIRFFFAAVTLKPTLDQQKMSFLQPQLQKIQAKYPNANTNKAEQQRLAMETKEFYKKNKVNMFSSLITLVIQFPLFLGVFGGFQGCAALSSDSIFGMQLSQTPWSVLQNTSLFSTGGAGIWWTAFVLMLILTLFQVVSMFLPQFIQKMRSKKNPKLGVNPSMDQNAKRMRIISIVMLVVLVFTSFGLTSGMCIYWLGGAIFNILQTLIMQFVVLKAYRKKQEKGE